jgi:lipopolysaccharide export system permease protein
MSVLGRYVSRMFLVRLAVVLFSIGGFGLLFDLLENGDSVLRGTSDRLGPLLHYGGLRLPVIFSEMLPLAALVAGILTVGDLLRHRELVIMWDGGVSPLGLIVRLIPVGLLLVVVKLALDDHVIPRATAELRAWGVGDYKRSSITGGSGEAIWLRSGDDVARIPLDAAARRRIDAITIFRRDDDGLLIERLDADGALPDADGWRLLDVTRRTIGAGRTDRLAELHWPGRIDLDEIALLAREPRELSMAQLGTIIAHQGFAIRATHPYETWLHVRLASAVVPFLLVLLAFALAGRFSRTATLAPIFIRSIAIGFSFHVIEGLVVALGEVGLLDPRIAAWGMPLGLAAVILLPPIIGELRLGGTARRLGRA